MKLIPQCNNLGYFSRRMAPALLLVAVTWFGMLVLAFSPSTAKADTALENESLTALLEQLRIVHALVDQAEQNSDQSKRVNFNYAAVRADIKTIELGVEQYVAGMRDAPKRIEPLGGEYRR